ncbi:hypothetical protein GCM10028806_30500 [Spirosoma terrae]
MCVYIGLFINTEMAFQLIGIVDENRPYPSKKTLLALLANGLNYIYHRSATPVGLPTDSLYGQNQILLAAPAPDMVPPPYRWHLKEADRLRLSAQEDLKTHLPFSTSIHNLADWPALAGRVELVFYSPLFPSISKTGYAPTVPLDELARQVQAIRAKQHQDLPRLIGLGGIDATNVSQVRQAGFDGAALMGALWQNHDPVTALQQIKASISA